jgi:gamma-tubulin complex component 3
MDPGLAHVQYFHPSALTGGIGQLSGDGGFTGIGGDVDDVPDREGGLRLWEAKYRFQKEMLPMFVGESFGRKACLLPIIGRRLAQLFYPQIFSTGKSLNFIRYSCHDSDWVVTREKMSNTGGSEYTTPPSIHIPIFISFEI